MLTRYRDEPTGLTIEIEICGRSIDIRRHCRVTLTPETSDMQTIEKACRRFCRKNDMKFVSFHTARPYELGKWQDKSKAWFIAECTTKTPKDIYEFSKRRIAL